MEAREILEQVKTGNMSVEEAEKYFRRQPFEELGYAKLDTHREIRSGFPEVVYCSGKPDAYLRKPEKSSGLGHRNGSMNW